MNDDTPPERIEQLLRRFFAHEQPQAWPGPPRTASATPRNASLSRSTVALMLSMLALVLLGITLSQWVPQTLPRAPMTDTLLGGTTADGSLRFGNPRIAPTAPGQP
jgi:hypothetical protein